jgi:hypothetical protein
MGADQRKYLRPPASVRMSCMKLAQVLAPLLCACVAGCAPRRDPTLEAVQQQAQSQLNQHLVTKGLASNTCTRIHLAKIGADKYRGLAYFTDGSKSGVSVEVDPATGALIVK